MDIFPPEVHKVMKEYIDQNNAENVPLVDLQKSQEQVLYLPLHIIHKETSTTTEVQALFASATTSMTQLYSGGCTCHVSISNRYMDSNRIALVADVSRMYRTILLAEPT